MHFDYDDNHARYVARDDDGQIACHLQFDEDEAKREFALREVLDDWTSNMEIHRGNYIEVNRHQKAEGISPEEAKEKVAWVKECLAKVKSYQPNAMTPEASGPNFHLMTLEQLRGVGYTTLNLYVELDCPDDVAKGVHDLVNLLYTLTERSPSYSREENYVSTIREAWDGEPVDRRQWYAASDAEYLVVTDDEADALWDEDLDNYIDECLEIPGHLKNYFDREAWKRDARVEGRAHSLNRYDGREDSVDVDGERFYIYRQH